MTDIKINENYAYNRNRLNEKGQVAFPGIPVQDTIFEAVLPSAEWAQDFTAANTALVGRSIFLADDCYQFDTLQEYQSIYGIPAEATGIPDWLSAAFSLLEVTKLAKEYPEYIEDDMFALQRVAGINPGMLTRITNREWIAWLPDDALAHSHVADIDTIQQAIHSGRLYGIDYTASLQSIKNGQNSCGQKYSYAPRAVFIAPKQCGKNQLLSPVAIQCKENEDIFFPDDGMAWQVAKAVFQNADFTYHELISHLGKTHVLMGIFAVATGRILAENAHPIGRLLQPHFEGTVYINTVAQNNLMSDGGPFDLGFSGTIASYRDLLKQVFADLSFNDEMFPVQIMKKGLGKQVASDIVRPRQGDIYYPYLEDACALWNAIYHWVKGYVDYYYASDERCNANTKVAEDAVLQAWAQLLHNSDGGGIGGFGDNGNGAILTTNYLKEALTMIIFTASAQHAAVNYPQYDYASYPPNMSPALYRELPAKEDMKSMTEQEYVDLLPSRSISYKIVDLTYGLTQVHYTQLGVYTNVTCFPETIQIYNKEFRKKLKRIERDIERRNRKITKDFANTKIGEFMAYTYLMPSTIPQSINT